MSIPVRRKNGNLIVPDRIMIPGGPRADGTRELTPADPEYAQWEQWMKEQGFTAEPEKEEKKRCSNG